MADNLIPGPGIRRYGSAKEVEAVYKKTYFRQLKVPEKIATFGDPSQKNFEAEYIRKAYLVGCGANRDTTLDVELHRGVVPIMEQIFREILAAGLDYRIRPPHCYSFRYVKDSVTGAWLNHPDYAGLSPTKDPHLSYSRRDRELGRLHVKIDGTEKDRFDRLSNHAYGTAIDINGNDNEYKNDGKCDIHPEIVKIFQNHKFFWGGFYNSRRDYMHFEYSDTVLDAPDEIRKTFFFPIQLGDGKNPALYYDNNESTTHLEIHTEEDVAATKEANKKEEDAHKKDPENAKKTKVFHEVRATESQSTEGGFFPLALPSGGKSSLHGGIHLASTRHGDPVVAMAPGYIVAVRMAELENNSTNETVHQQLRNWNNFVLVRHDVSPDGEKEYYPLYSLYMHLAAFQAPALGNAPIPQKIQGDLADIPWLRSLYLGRFGVLIRVSDVGAPPEDSFPLGACLWPAEPLRDAAGKDKLQVKALTLDGSQLVTVSVKSETDAEGKSMRWWEWKAPQQHLGDLWSLLREGSVVSFDRPFIPVQAGDILGRTDNFPTKPFPPLNGKGGTEYKIINRLVHWEVFSTQESGVLSLLVERMEKASKRSIESNSFPTLEFTDPAILFDGDQIRKEFRDASVPNLKSSAPEGLDKVPKDFDPGDLLALYNEGTKQGSTVQVRFELRHLVEPSKCDPKLEEHVLRMKWTKKVNNKSQAVGPIYLLRITDTKASITREGGDAVKKLPPDVALTSEHWDRKFPTVEHIPKTVEFFLEGPLNAEQLQIERVSAGVQIGSRESPALTADFARFKELTSKQWRNLLLNKASDWVPAANKEALGDGVKESVPDGSLAWWNGKTENPVMGSSTYLIGGDLPENGMIQNMHPVTLKWILELLHIDRLQRVSDQIAEKLKQQAEARELAKQAKKLTGKGNAEPEVQEPPKIDPGEKIWPLFRDPLERKVQETKKPTSVMDPVGVGFLVRDEKVGLGESFLVVLADELYRIMESGRTAPVGSVRLEKQADNPVYAPVGQTPVPAPSMAASALSRTPSNLSFDSLMANAKDEATSFGMSTARDALGAVKSGVTDALTSSDLADDPEIRTVFIPKVLRFVVEIGGTGIGATEIGADFWGVWKVIPDHDQCVDDTKVWGKETIQIPTPSFGEIKSGIDVIEAVPETPGLFSWAIPWGLPPLRSGFRTLVELVRVKDGARTPSGLCVPGYSLPGLDPASSLLDKDLLDIDALYIKGLSKAGKDKLASMKPPAPKDPKKKQKAPPPLMITSEFSWNDLSKWLPKGRRIHERLLRALNDLAILAKAQFKVESIDADGNGCVISTASDLAGAVYKVNAFRKFVPVKGTETAKTKKFHLTIPPFAGSKIEFTFSPKPLLKKVFEEVHPDWVGSDYSFDMHFVRGFGRNFGYINEELMRLPKEIPEGSVVSHSLPDALGSFSRAFGKATATPNWVKVSTKKNAPQELTWEVDVELLGDLSLWQAGQVQMRLCQKADLHAGIAAEDTPWQTANQSGGLARSIFSRGKSKNPKFLETGKFTVELKYIPKPTKASKGSVPKSTSGLLDGLKSSASSMLAESEAEAKREMDLTPGLGQVSVKYNGGLACISIPTQGLFTAASGFDPNSPPAEEIAGVCRLEIRSAEGALIQEPGAPEGNRTLSDPDHVLRWNLRLAPGTYECKICPPPNVRGISLEPVSVTVTIPAEVK